MATASQTAPAASIDTIVGGAFEGAWVRAGQDRTDNHPELFEIELFRHLGSHTGEVALWTIKGALGPEALDDQYSVPLPPLIVLAGDYCWRVRLRDNYGTWTAWTSKAVFAYTSETPVLSNPTIPEGSTFETLQHVFFGADYSDADGDRPHRLYITLHPFGGEPVATYAEATWPKASPADNQGGGLSRYHFINDGDHPHSGDLDHPLTGLVAYQGAFPYVTGFVVSGSGPLTIRCQGSASVVLAGPHVFTASIRVNGVVVGQDTQTTNNGTPSARSWVWDFTVTGVSVETGDIIEFFCNTSAGAPGFGSGTSVLPIGAGQKFTNSIEGELSVGDIVDPDLLLWKTNGKYHGLRNSAKVGTWYDGRSLDEGSYYWEMYATDKRGSVSNTLSGTFTLSKGQEPDPGASPNLTGYASP